MSIEQHEMPFKNVSSKLFISNLKHRSFIISGERHLIDIVSYHKRQGILEMSQVHGKHFLTRSYSNL